jgi:CheY-like chemotaxis protein
MTLFSDMNKNILLLIFFFWLIWMPDNLAFGNHLPETLNRTITVKGDRYYPPYEFINDQGEPDGFNVELFRELAKELHLNYHLELEPWDQVRPQLENKEIDVITGMMISEERAKKVLFGIPHSIITPGLFTRKNENINTIDDLLGKQVIVQSGDRMHDYLYVAVDGDEALSFLLCTGKFEQRRQNKAVKVIFLDLKLPKISGLEVLKEIKNHPITCKTPVVIVSSSAQDQDIKRAYELGANGYVVKPLDFNDFQTAMSAAGIYWLSVNEPPR